MYLSRIYNRYMHGHDILNLIKARAQREPRTECRARLRAVQGRSEKRVFSAQTRGRKEDRRARARRVDDAKNPISITDVKVNP